MAGKALRQIDCRESRSGPLPAWRPARIVAEPYPWSAGVSARSSLRICGSIHSSRVAMAFERHQIDQNQLAVLLMDKPLGRQITHHATDHLA